MLQIVIVYLLLLINYSFSHLFIK